MNPTREVHPHTSVSIVGFNLPGSTFYRPDGSPMVNVHVGVQHRRDPAELVRADSSEARWDAVLELIERDGGLDFKGPRAQVWPPDGAGRPHRPRWWAAMRQGRPSGYRLVRPR
jgi:hypothetical protein